MTDILKSHFLNLYAIALSDTHIDTVELEILYKIGQEKGIAKTEIDEIILKPDNVKFVFPESLDEKITYLYDFAKIILADGIIDKNERTTLELFCTRFGFEEENIEEIADFLIASAREDLQVSALLKIINENAN